MEKLISYKSRFIAAFDLLFRPEKFKKLVQKKINNLIEAKAKAQREDFEERIQFMFFEKSKTLVKVERFDNSILRIPVSDDVCDFMRGIDFNNIYPASIGGDDVIEKRIEVMPFSMSSNVCTVQRMKELASREIAKKLIDEGFIDVKECDGFVNFNLNYISC